MQNEQLIDALNQLVWMAHGCAVKHGFYDDDALLAAVSAKDEELKPITLRYGVLSKLALIDSEVGEAVHAIQHGEQDNLYEELCDVIIRTFDLAGHLEFNLGARLLEKMEQNERRPYRHGKQC